MSSAARSAAADLRHGGHRSQAAATLFCLALFAVVSAAGPAQAEPRGRPGPTLAPLHVGQIAAQSQPTLPGSEPDTVTEPDVAVSPRDPHVAVAVTQEGRYPDGGAVGIAYVWTHDGGEHWHQHALPGVTAGTGGDPTWARATDAVAAFGADGSLYVSTLLFNTGCDSAVAVSRSTDGGETFAAPVLAHRSSTCAVADDKNWLVVDNSASSPHQGRLYQFWTPFLSDIFGNADGAPQAVVYSDDRGRTWSQPFSVTEPHANTQNSQPVVQADGTIIDAYLDFGASAGPPPEAVAARTAVKQATQAVPAKAQQVRPSAPGQRLRTRLSHDGGVTWSSGGDVTAPVGGGPAGIRCCLPSVIGNMQTGMLHAAWNSVDTATVMQSSSPDGIHWSRPVNVSGPARANESSVNVDITAFGGDVVVSYAMTNTAGGQKRTAQQFVARSRDTGRSFGAPVSIGAPSDYAYAARAPGIFPGDYIGTAMSQGRLYAVWCRSSTPPRPGAQFHQVLDAASFAF